MEAIIHCTMISEANWPRENEFRKALGSLTGHSYRWWCLSLLSLVFILTNIKLFLFLSSPPLLLQGLSMKYSLYSSGWHRTSDSLLALAS